MKPFVLTLRAIGTRLALRLYIPTVITLAVIMALLMAGVLWLTTLSEWWWLLFSVIIILVCVATAVAVVLFLLIRHVRPSQTDTQKQAVKLFVDKLQNAADIVGTPKIIILFRVVRSIAAPSKEPYLSDLVAHKDLARDFRELQQLFTK